jgi:CubicO group peptidase (beta-lactamase class C family)
LQEEIMSRSSRRIVQLALAVAALAVVTLAIGASPLLAAPSKQEIEQSIQRVMEGFQVPGMAVSVVYDGQLYYAGGHGLVEIGKEQMVDEQTLFQIGSVSKAFTAAALALLADEGKLGWDDRVIDHLPEFRMFDPWVTREFTIRDLLTHRSGLPLGAGDLLVFPEGNATREEIIHALRYLEPSSSFRAKFDYDNLLYIVAGEVAARVAGMPFEEFLEQRLLFPLGMTDCSATLERAAPGAAKATPHLLIDGQLQTTTAGADGVIAAAGGINCSARSMALWMSFVLNKGLPAEGVQLISTAQFDQLLSPVTILPAAGYLEEHAGSWLSAYALGWNVSTFYGQPMLAHGGGLWGMTTFIMLLPQQGLALFASNNLMSPAPRAIVNELADEFLAVADAAAGERNKDWIAIISGVYQERQDGAAATVAEAAAARAADSRPSLPLAAYAGTYRDPWYGDVHITLGDDGNLHFRSDRNEPLQGPLEHFQHDTFIARWTDRQLMADAYVSFSLSPEGGVERIRMKAVSPMTDFSYDFHDLDLARVE